MKNERLIREVIAPAPTTGGLRILTDADRNRAMQRVLDVANQRRGSRWSNTSRVLALGAVLLGATLIAMAMMGGA